MPCLRRALAAAAILATMGALLAPATASAAEAIPSELYYSTYVGGIGRFAPGPTSPVQFDDNGSDPSVSPDGRRIAYSAFDNPTNPTERRLVVAGRDGSGPVVVYSRRIAASTAPSAIEDPVWSPDGRQLAFVVDNSLWRLNMRTGESQRLTASRTGRVDSEPSWSPDGSRIAFSRINADQRALLITIRPDGSGQQTVFRDPTDRPVSNETDPDWSPDSKRIAFTFTPSGGGSFGSQLAVINRDGSNLRVLTDDEQVMYHQPAWSPDGRRIAVARYTSSGVEDSDDGIRIWSVRPDGSDPRLISPFLWFEEALESLDWAPAVSG